MRVHALLATHDLPPESLPWMEEARGIFDELVIFIDAKRATPGVAAEAEKVASRVHRHDAETWYEWDLGSMARTCDSDWVFIIERDEQLSPEWRQPEWRKILESTDLTHFWVPRRWIVPGGRYIAADPWWPDSQLRLIRNHVSGAVFPTRLHDPIHMPGPGGHFSTLALHHHVLWMCSRQVREERMRYYEQLRPGGALDYYYLYEDHAPPEAELPNPAKVNIEQEVVGMEKLPPEKAARVGLEVSRVPREINASMMFWIDAHLTNRTDETLYSVAPYPVRLSYHWLRETSREVVVFEGIRSALFPGLAANATGQVAMTVLAPNEPGHYLLQTTVVQDGVRWHEEVQPEILQEFPVSVRKKITFDRDFPYGFGKTERVIEIPWALSRYKGGRRVLEVGCSFASESPEYIEGLLSLNISELHGIDVSSVEAPQFIKRTGDIRKSGYDPEFFDFILCISTLEHVGKDNAKHYKPIAELPPDRPGSLPPDGEALVEMFRILKPGGKLIVTVPFGKFVDHGWFTHYDSHAISGLFQTIPSAKIEAEYFKYTEAGWMPCPAAALAGTSYGDNAAPAAAGLACFEITKP